MSRFVNAALVTFVNGFVLLTIFGYFLGAEVDAEQEGPSLGEASASWGPASEGDSVLLLELPLRNGGQGVLRATAAHYEVRSGGTVLASGDVVLSVAVPPGITAPLRVPLHLGPGFPSKFWHLYAAEGESVRLQAAGSVDLVQGEEAVSLPFSWSEGWRGGLAEGVAAARPGCGAQALCVSGASLAWRDGGADLLLELRNQGDASLLVGGGEASLALAGSKVLAGQASDAGLRLAPQGTGTLVVRLAVDPEGAAQWWPGHVQRCELSAASLAVRLAHGEGEGTRGEPALIPLPPFETSLVCGREA